MLLKLGPKVAKGEPNYTLFICHTYSLQHIILHCNMSPYVFYSILQHVFICYSFYFFNYVLYHIISTVKSLSRKGLNYCTVRICLSCYLIVLVSVSIIFFILYTCNIFFASSPYPFLFRSFFPFWTWISSLGVRSVSARSLRLQI